MEFVDWRVKIHTSWGKGKIMACWGWWRSNHSCHNPLQSLRVIYRATPAKLIFWAFSFFQPDDSHSCWRAASWLWNLRGSSGRSSSTFLERAATGLSQHGAAKSWMALECLWKRSLFFDGRVREAKSLWWSKNRRALIAKKIFKDFFGICNWNKLKWKWEYKWKKKEVEANC